VLLAMILGMSLNQTPVTEIVNKIEELNPRLSDIRAKKLAKIIVKESDHYDIDPNILVAILRQESNFEPGQNVCYIVHRHHACFTTCDVGVSQINKVWLDKWSLNEEDMVKNDALNIHIAARVLSIIKRQFGEEENWFSRYNTSGPRRAIYEASVKDYLAAIEE
jgi:hypothetical protein